MTEDKNKAALDAWSHPNAVYYSPTEVLEKLVWPYVSVIKEALTRASVADELAAVLDRAECDLARFHKDHSDMSQRWRREDGKRNEWVAETLNLIQNAKSRYNALKEKP